MIRLSDLLPADGPELVGETSDRRVKRLIAAGNEFCEINEDPAAIARLAVKEIRQKRLQLFRQDQDQRPRDDLIKAVRPRTAYASLEICTPWETLRTSPAREQVSYRAPVCLPAARGLSWQCRGPRMAAEGWYSVSRRQLLADRRLAVFLTGGGSGMGAAIFGELATTVGCVSCHRTVAFKAEHVAPIAMDVPDHAAVRQASTSFAEFVWPAGLVNNAGAHHSKPNIEQDLADVRDSLEPNRIAVVRLAQLARETGPNSPNSSAHKDDSIHAKVSCSIPVRKDRHRGKRSAAWLAACPKSGMRILGGSINNY